MLKTKFLRVGNYESHCSLDHDARNELNCWVKNLDFCKGRSLIPKPVSLVITTDACNTGHRGWGAVCNNVKISEKFSSFELKKHINVLGLLGAYLALKSFARNSSDSSIKIRIDNTSAVAAINHLGSPLSPELTALAQDIWSWAMAHNLNIIAEHNPGAKNIKADAASRGSVKDSEDWKLDPVIFSRISNLWGPFSIDLFASHHNHQFCSFFSWRPNPSALAFIALIQD
uniref:RNase H type-1 domain-containing protein n=1 Tax=Strigamia maritima TaxID=126957 RepID=T1IK55_STRMM